MEKSKIRKFSLILKFGLVIITALSTVMMLNETALAYVLRPWKWVGNTNYYDPSALTSTWIQIVSDGSQVWNNVTPSPFTILRNDSSTNDVYMIYIDGQHNTLGRAWVYCGGSLCNAAGQTVTRVVLEFDTAENWWLNASCNSLPNNAYDARGVAAHEFGHYATLGHSSSCSTADPATMCAVTIAGNDSCKAKTLTSDDRAGLNAQYP